MGRAIYIILMSLFITVGILSQCGDSAVTCKDDNGNNVDWYILYKFPQQLGNGLSYLYMDRDTNGWIPSTMGITNPNGALGHTLRPLLDYYIKGMNGFGYLLYSDQPPASRGVSNSYGHSKGIVMLDNHTGVWLSHSTPRFPTYRNQNFWPSSGTQNAQTFLCMTYGYSQFKEIGLQLKYIHPYTYDHHIPKTFHPELKCVPQRGCFPRKKRGTKPPRDFWTRVKDLTSAGGQTFKAFAKYTHFGDDLYSGLISSVLRENLSVRSWGRMNRPLPSNCSIPYYVYNVKAVTLNIMSFRDTVDHSKWCVAPLSGWICIADMNREASQMSRGGGAVCTQNSAAAQSFNATVSIIEQCRSPAPQNRKRNWTFG